LNLGEKGKKEREDSTKNIDMVGTFPGQKCGEGQKKNTRWRHF